MCSDGTGKVHPRGFRILRRETRCFLSLKKRLENETSQEVLQEVNPIGRLSGARDNVTSNSVIMSPRVVPTKNNPLENNVGRLNVLSRLGAKEPNLFVSNSTERDHYDFMITAMSRI